MQLLEQIAALITRGDRVAIHNGRLLIETHDSRAVPAEWLETNEPLAMVMLANALDIQIFQYLGYTTGNYGRAKAGGLTLQLVNAATGESAYVIFNVDTRYRRNTKFHKCGSRLPNGKFTASANGLFVQLWKSCGLTMPPRMGAFSDRMGKLKPIYFTGIIGTKERIEKPSFRPFTVSENDIKTVIGIGCNDQTISEQITNNFQTKNKQAEQTREPLEPFNSNAFSNKQATGDFCHGYKGTRGHGYKGSSNTPICSPSNQTTDEWLNDYDQAS